MTAAVLLSIYCVLIIVASLAGGLVPMVVRLTHRRMELALSFVSGVMLGVAMLHLLPGAILEHQAWLAGHDAGASVVPAVTGAAPDHGHDGAHGPHGSLDLVFLWVLAGFMVMFFLERYFCFHHHVAPDPGDAPEDVAPEGCDHAHDAATHHQLRWSGAAVGLAVHTLIAGVALAASVRSERAHAEAASLFGLGTFLVIFLHKPFDSLTIGTLMAAGRHSTRARHLVNVLFSLCVPVGVVLFHLGVGSGGDSSHRIVSVALAFTTGTFLCIALSDLLPELQFHRHDRFKLSLAVVLGLAVAWLVGVIE